MNTSPATVKRDDRVVLYITIGIAALVAAATLITGGSRIAAVAPGEDVAIDVDLSGSSAELPLGPEGAPVDVDLLSGTVTVGDPSSATMAAALAEPIVAVLAVLAGVAIFSIVVLRVARGTAFVRGTHHLLYTLAMLILVAGTAVTVLHGFASTSALSDLGGDIGFALTVNLLPIFVSLAVAAIGVAFEAAHRVSKDAEGLV